MPPDPKSAHYGARAFRPTGMANLRCVSRFTPGRLRSPLAMDLDHRGSTRSPSGICRVRKGIT
jgi:hypothetical protein